jgi:hypothetical protein
VETAVVISHDDFERLSGAAGSGHGSLATALEHGLTVATRNVDDFRRAHAPVVNPFEAS